MKRSFKIALAGNPNCGKTTIFNLLTGTHQHVGNYSGVTVERKIGVCRMGEIKIEIVDLPGIYSLSSATAEERVAFSELMAGDVDLILDVIDSGNAQRNLYLTTQLAELNLPMILVFNMIDEARDRGLVFNFPILERFFGAPIVEAVGATGDGIDVLKRLLLQKLCSTERNVPRPIDFGNVAMSAIRELSEGIAKLKLPLADRIPLRYLAIRMLEQDDDIRKLPQTETLEPILKKWRKEIYTRFGVSSETYIADCRYGMIAGACREAITEKKQSRHQFSEEIDRIVTNRYLGLPIFFLMMFVVFFLTFQCSIPLMNLLEFGFTKLGDLVNALWPAGRLEYLHSLIVEGIIGGVGGVLVFLPNILILFLAIAFLEGTGYMARAAFVMDGFMHKFGLHGKSFIPMLLGFGCTVPAIMATRTIESERDRLTTILVLPLMSCGARLPIYSLLIPAFFPPFWQAPIMWLIYLIGVVLALLCAGILKSTLFKGEDDIFVMELPPYRMPTLRSILLYMLERTMMYLHKAGTFILTASIILFLFNTLPEKPKEMYTKDYAAETVKVEQATNLSEQEKKSRIQTLSAEKEKEHLQYSIAGRIGNAMTVVFRPIGFDWKICSALIGAFAGKELFVSQLGILNSFGDAEENATSLREKLRADYTPLQGFCIMLFCLITMPCIATVAVVKRETNSWKWMFFQMIGLTLLAYLITLAVYQIGLLFQ